MSSEVILKVENISKQYRLGLFGTGTISHDLNRWWAKLRGKEDPYLKIGEINDRSKKAESDYVWALKDIDFEVKRGEVLGIIGKNGAGKSTLLKILSQVTGPTKGSIKSKGRIASLLEVGTGFHPEMTGKENIFLNGAILGMTKKEITSKLHEIIDFSGCERFIDTPVKRYSSGMKVRLAFAVAAHLEPEILVVDEVLAVGDAEFQKKAIGKMQDISNTDGRTVLFVSHDMGAVKSLCSRLLVLTDGSIGYLGELEKGLDFYLKKKKQTSGLLKLGKNLIKQIKIDAPNGFTSGDDLIIKIDFEINVPLFSPFISFIIKNERGVEVAEFHSRGIMFNQNFTEDLTLELSAKKFNIHLGEYSVDLRFFDGKKYEFNDVLTFNCIQVKNHINRFHKLKNNFFFEYKLSIKN